jgi:uncharacterized membrane protein YdjX (TVP38/TMEM64 family)
VSPAPAGGHPVPGPHGLGPLGRLRRALAWAQLAPALRAAVAVVLLFVVAALLARSHAEAIRGWIGSHAAPGMAVFVASSALAVLLPLLSNLPLVPLAAIAWGPWWTAALLLAGWVLGAMLSFTLGRHARAAVTRHLPSVQRHADIERLIHPRHRLISLVLLRMTFPVDLLSYALGLFSPQTTLRDNALSTALGAAPFALLFAWAPAMPPLWQGGLFGVCTLAFLGHVRWVLRAPSPPT